MSAIDEKHSQSMVEMINEKVGSMSSLAKRI
jgi:hypothetical protein